MLTWFVPAVGLALYLILVPPVPDFAAQATRAAVFHQLGSATWWPGWYGGLELPTYSVIAPGVMATIGVATVVATWRSDSKLIVLTTAGFAAVFAVMDIAELVAAAE